MMKRSVHLIIYGLKLTQSFVYECMHTFTQNAISSSDYDDDDDDDGSDEEVSALAHIQLKFDPIVF